MFLFVSIFGVDLSYLESPRMENDPVRPGQQWFCYWRTSAALWESRILQSGAHEIFFIPIYWGFHAESPTSWDFGQIHPERDLLRLSQLLTQHRRKFCWLIPVTPAPFLTNGGVPVTAARTLSISEDGVHLACLDQEDKLNKMYSFFEQKVFSVYSDFLTKLGAFLSQNQIKAPVWGVKFQYLENGKIVSYMNDSSLAFEQGFSRFLKQNFREGADLRDPSEENKLKKHFTQQVEVLFTSTVESTLAPYWQGVQSLTMMGGSPKETIERAIPENKSQLHYFKDLFESYSHDRFVSTVLLKASEKGEILPKVMEEFFGEDEMERRFHYKLSGGELTEEWVPYGLVNIFDGGHGHFRDTGLLNFLDQNYRWMYSIMPSLDFSSEWIEANQHRVKFFHGHDLDRTRFAQMMKLFMMGQRVVLDRSELDPELDKRLQIFFLENNLKLQTVNFITNVTMCELGEGCFITFEGERLKNNESSKFWANLFSFFKINHPETKADEDIFSLWKIRATTPHELNYLDVRRVSFYNPTSYKKNVTVHTKGHFAFMKMIDPSKAQAKSVSHGVEVELLPNGRIALDFGHYEEK